jgi:hypothetical protein
MFDPFVAAIYIAILLLAAFLLIFGVQSCRYGLRRLPRSPLHRLPAQIWNDPDTLLGLMVIGVGVGIPPFLIAFYFVETPTSRLGQAMMLLCGLAWLGALVPAFRKDRLERSLRLPRTQREPPHTL